MIGSGDQHNELIEKAAELGISNNIVFAGFHGGRRAQQAFTLSDIFMMPSVSEPFGITALEAMGFGNATIISKQSGVSEMIKNTFKVDFWDTQALADRVVSLARNDGLRETMSQNVLNEVEKANYHKSAGETHMIYHHAIGASS